MVKLYIFDSVEEAKAFALDDTRVADPSTEISHQAVADKPANPDKEAFKERILRKIKGKHGARHCKLCGEAGHRRDNCPSEKNRGVEEAVDHIDRIMDETDE